MMPFRLSTALNVTPPLDNPHRPALSWPRAMAWTLGAAYLPLLAMCLYTLGWVGCSHCKVTVWQLSPIGPGLFLWHLTRAVVDLPRLSDGIELTVAIVLTLPLLTLLAAAFHFSGRWRIPVGMLLLLGSSWLAFALYSVVRA
jgi:hypothetical protein